MSPDDKSEKSKQVLDWLQQLKGSIKDVKLLPPPNLWQRFWQNYNLRIFAGLGFIVLLAILVPVVLFYFDKPDSQTLATYVPAEAWLYLEFDLQSAEWQDLVNRAPTLARDLNDFFIAQGLNQELINLSSSIALAGIIEKEELSWTWLLRTPAPRQLEVFLPFNTFLRQPGEQVAVISANQKIISKFSFKKNRYTPNSRAQDLWSGFIRPQRLAKLWSQVAEANIFMQVWRDWLSGLAIEIGFQVRLADDQLLITTHQASLAEPTQRAGRPVSDLVISQINLSQSLGWLENSLAKLPLANFYWQDFKERTAQVYQLNWHVLKTILDKPASLSLNLKQPDLELAPQDLALIKLSDYEIILDLASPLGQAEQEFIKELIKQVVARAVPSEVDVTLPDGTTAVDLIAQPELLDFDLYEDIAGSAYLSLPEENIEVILLPQAGRFIIANSSQLLEAYLTRSVIPSTSSGQALSEQSESKDLMASCGTSEADLSADLSAVASAEVGALAKVETAYLSDKILKNISFMQDFSHAVISLFPNSLNVCLTLDPVRGGSSDDDRRASARDSASNGVDR